MIAGLLVASNKLVALRRAKVVKVDLIPHQVQLRSHARSGSCPPKKKLPKLPPPTTSRTTAANRRMRLALA